MKQAICNTLQRWIRQRPGLDFGDYRTSNHAESARAYRSELRSITRDLHDAETLLYAVRFNDSITADDLIEASQHAYAGRLTITTTPEGKVTIDYCVGQYWATEYRRAACAVLAYALWERFRAESNGHPRATAKQYFSRSICQKWFQ